MSTNANTRDDVKCELLDAYAKAESPEDFIENVLIILDMFVTSLTNDPIQVMQLVIGNEREKGLEAVLAFIIETRFNGSLTFTREQYNAWTLATKGGHIEDVGPGDEIDLRVHYQGQSKPRSDSLFN
jgi:hypothetical protein